MFASGCSALVFQVAWIRELRLVFGATTASVAAVLAIFMAGLGVGSAILGKRADRVANPLRMYGMLEAAIALSVAVTPWLIELASSIYIGLGGQESLGLAGATVVRLALAGGGHGGAHFPDGRHAAGGRAIRHAGYRRTPAGLGRALRIEHAGSRVRGSRRHLFRARKPGHSGHIVGRLRPRPRGGHDRNRPLPPVVTAAFPGRKVRSCRLDSKSGRRSDGRFRAAPTPATAQASST